MKYSTEELFTAIRKSIFTTEPPFDYADLAGLFIKLCDQIKAEADTNWSIGECTECALDDLIVGAYWHYTEWHAGQYTESYAALCALGSIFQPGYSSEPEPDTAERDVYLALHNLAEGSQNETI